MTRGRSFMPRFRDSVRAVGIPALSSLTESWILHDVHDPQSANALITTSQRAISSGKQSASVRLILRFGISLIASLRHLSSSPPLDFKGRRYGAEAIAAYGNDPANPASRSGDNRRKLKTKRSEVIEVLKASIEGLEYTLNEREDNSGIISK